MQDALRHPLGDPYPLATASIPGVSFGFVSTTEKALPLGEPMALSKAHRSGNHTTLHLIVPMDQGFDRRRI